MEEAKKDNPCWRGYHPDPKQPTKMKNGKQVPNCIPIKLEKVTSGNLVGDKISFEEGMDHEVSMAQNALKDIISNASKLQHLVGEEEKDIPGWIQDHISQAQNFISQAATNFHELDGGGETGEYDVEDQEDVSQFVAYMKENYLGLNESSLEEAEYHGRKVSLGKPMRGDVKKFKVYVKNPKGKVVKVNFGQKGMNIKKNNPKRRKSFRARHNCANPGPRTKARYWSCRKW
jgi:hypothetical protein